MPLSALAQALVASGTVALRVEQAGRTLADVYAPDWHADRPHYTASLAKLVVGGLSLMTAVGLERIALDDRACRYVPAWRGDPPHAAITVRHLATHCSGLDDAEEGGLAHDALSGWKGAFWRRDPDPFSIARDQAPVLFPAGTRHQYSNPGYAMLGYCMTAALAGSATPDLRTLLAERVYRPLGVPDSAWSIGYGAPSDLDGLKLYATWGGGGFTPATLIAVGRLLLRGGGPVLSPSVVRAFLADASAPRPDDPDALLPLPGLYGNVLGTWPEAPRDLLVGAGAGHQALVVVPSLDLVIARMGAQLEPGVPFWTALRRRLVAPVLAALGR